MALRTRPSRRATKDEVFAAIDVGTNALRLELAKALPDGTLVPIYQERTPVRLGEGLYDGGFIKPKVAERLVAALRCYGALCRRYHAKVRAVGTSALREAKNREQLLARIRREAGVSLEVISGTEEARLICLGVLQGAPPLARSLCVDIGGGSTEVAFAIGPRPQELWSVALGAVRLTELFDAAGKIPKGTLRLLRSYAAQALEEALPSRIRSEPRTALGSGGTIGAVVAFAGRKEATVASAQQLSRAVEALAAMPPALRRKRFDPKRAEVIVAGAVILEALVARLGLGSVQSVDEGLREGVLVDLLGRRGPPQADGALLDAAVHLGQRLGFDEAHGQQVRRLALSLFDHLEPLHGLSSSARRLLEVAALLHDLGCAVSYQRHHKHTQYLLENADLPGLGERERKLCALMARFHRRSHPEPGHPSLAGLSTKELQLLGRCACLLRVADALDRSHRQAVRQLTVQQGPKAVTLGFRARGPIELELWDLEREGPFFEEIFDRKLRLKLLP